MHAHELTNRMGAGKIDVQSCFSRSPRMSDSSHPKILRRGSPQPREGNREEQPTLMPMQDSHHLSMHSRTHSSPPVLGGYRGRKSIFSKEEMIFHSLFLPSLP